MDYFEAKQKLIEYNNSREYNTHPLSMEYYSWQDNFEALLNSKNDNIVVKSSRQTGKTTCALALAIHKATENNQKVVFVTDIIRKTYELEYDIKTICEAALENVKIICITNVDMLRGSKYDCSIYDLDAVHTECTETLRNLTLGQKFIFYKLQAEVHVW